jgi:hypothetical protein
VAAIALIAAPIAVLGGGDGGGDVAPADTALTDEVLLTADELPVRDDLAAWREIPTEGRTLACAPAPAAAPDAESSVRRDFGADGTDAPAGEPPVSVVRTEVLQFADEATAREQYDQAQRWIVGCPGGENLARTDVKSQSFDLAGGQGEWHLHESYRPDICPDGGCDAILFDRMGVAQFGDRVVLVSLAQGGGPLEPVGLDESMDELYRAAVTKAGGEVSGDSATSEELPTGAIPDGFPLATGWPDDSSAEPGPDYGVTGPNRSLPALDLTSPCGTAPDVPEPMDRLRADWVNVEDFRARELSLYASEEEAADVAAGVVEPYEACPTAPEREDGYVTETEVRELPVGDEAWALLESDTFDGQPSTFGETIVVVRVGAAVLVVSHGGHAGNPQGNEQGSIDAATGQAAAIIEAMSDL